MGRRGTWIRRAGAPRGGACKTRHGGPSRAESSGEKKKERRSSECRDGAGANWISSATGGRNSPTTTLAAEDGETSEERRARPARKFRDVINPTWRSNNGANEESAVDSLRR